MGEIITFYSYKGGTGRSMAVANVAWLLAADGQHVLVVDWDLEAPGLHRYFRPFLADPDQFETDGLIDAFWEVVTHALTPGSRDAPRTSDSPSLEVDLGNYISIDLEDYISPIDWDFGSSGGSIDFIGAGRQGATYSERVNTFDWKRFYALGGGRWLDRIKEQLTSFYNFVLIDSRTGVSDTSGICTIQMPHRLVACFTLNRQSIEGAAAVLSSIKVQRSAGGQSTEIMLFPAAMRIENSEKEKLELARAKARGAFSALLSEEAARDPRQYWDEMEVTYWPFYAYEEVLAAFGDTAGAAGSRKTLLSEMELLARRVTGRKELQAPEIPPEVRKQVLQKYAFGPLPTRIDTQRPEKDETEFLRTVYDKERLWQQRGYYYRYLLSERELHLIAVGDLEKFGRQMKLYYDTSATMHKFQMATTANFFILLAFVLLYITAFMGLRFYDQQILQAKKEAASKFINTLVESKDGQGPNSLDREKNALDIIANELGVSVSSEAAVERVKLLESIESASENDLNKIVSVAPIAAKVFDSPNTSAALNPLMEIGHSIVVANWYFGVALAAFSMMFLARLASQRRSSIRPYGLTFANIFILSLLGPFASDIPDYDSNEARPIQYSGGV